MLHVLLRHSGLLVLWGVICMLFVLGISFVFPFAYSAESQVLIISRDRSGVDPYTQAKSAERIGENLAQVMKTSNFFDKVMATDASFNKQRWLSLDDRAQRRQWQRDVRPEMVYSTSLLKITVLAPTKEEAAKFSAAVTQTVTTQGWEYIGGDVALKSVDNSLVSRLPARPNFVVNGFVGFVGGALLGALWVAKYKRHGLLERLQG